MSRLRAIAVDVAIALALGEVIILAIKWSLS
jgi:hypothetical protein